MYGEKKKKLMLVAWRAISERAFGRGLWFSADRNLAEGRAVTVEPHRNLI